VNDFETQSRTGILTAVENLTKFEVDIDLWHFCIWGTAWPCDLDFSPFDV